MKLSAQTAPLTHPTTYMGKNGKQYVVVNADNRIAAFALP